MIWPHRSLSRNGTKLLLGGTAAIFFVVAVRAALSGAWPQAIYIMLAVGGLAVALSSNTRSARFAQIIELAPDTVRVRMVGPAARSMPIVEFNPAWVRVIEAPGPLNDIRLLLRQSGRSVPIGEFLSPEERVNSLRNCGHGSRSAIAQPTDVPQQRTVSRSQRGSRLSFRATHSVRLSKRSQEDLAVSLVGHGIQALGPWSGSIELTALCGRARTTIPADLLHVGIQLHRVALRIDSEGGVVHARQHTLRHIINLYIALLQECDRVTKLLITAEAETDGEAGTLGREAQFVAKPLGIEHDE